VIVDDVTSGVSEVLGDDLCLSTDNGVVHLDSISHGTRIVTWAETNTSTIGCSVPGVMYLLSQCIVDISKLLVALYQDLTGYGPRVLN
jgi:hypothetical protein